MTYCFAFGGYKTSGKTTLAELLRTELQPRTTLHQNFADSVYAELASVLNISLDEIYKNKSVFRPALQWLGTEYWRNYRNEPEHWITDWQARFTVSESVLNLTAVVVSDVRFPNELAALRRQFAGGFRSVWVDRPGLTPDFTSGHISEISLIPADFDVRISNGGTKTDLARVAENLAGLLD